MKTTIIVVANALMNHDQFVSSAIFFLNFCATSTMKKTTTKTTKEPLSKSNRDKIILLKGSTAMKKNNLLSTINMLV